MSTTEPNNSKQEWPIKCLHCENRVIENYCSNCGQSSKTKRFSTKEVFSYMFIERLFFVDKGLLFTLKELSMRPGHSIREYVNGKRANHLNYFTFIVIIIIGLSMLQMNTTFRFSDLSTEKIREIDFLQNVRYNYPKLFFIVLILLSAVSSYFLFLRAKNNYAEHVVLNTYKNGVLLLFNMVEIGFATFMRNLVYIQRMSDLLTLLSMGYGIWFYNQYFSPIYHSKVELLIRSSIATVLPLFAIISVLVAIIVHHH